MVTQEELQNMSPEEIQELQRKNCIFCKIIAGEVPGHEVFSNEHTHALLDIHPAVDGHTLVMPKEHVPILPLLPPVQFKALFDDVKDIAKGIKQAKMVEQVSVFVANGPAAGQQASHFLLHVIPRAQGDALSKHFSLPRSSEHEDVQKQIIEPLRKNLPLMMQNHFKRIGGRPFKEQPSNAPSEERLQPPENQQEQIVQFFEQYPQARTLLEQDIDQFKQLLEKVQPEVRELFSGLDLHALSEQLRKVEKPQGFTAADVFTGDDPSAQAERVVQYFMQKPKAKELFLNDIDAFKRLLSAREDVKPLFEDVDLDKLQLVLEKILPGDDRG